jgi:WD40 repeat protein
VVSADEEGNVMLWDLQTLKVLAVVPGGSKLGVSQVALSHNGAQIIVGYKYNGIEIWDLHLNRLAILAPKLNGVTRLSLSPDGKRLLAGFYSGPAQVWDLTRLEE